MDLIQLRQMGLMASNPLVKKTITFKYHPLIDQSADADPNGPRSEKLVEGSTDFWLRKFTAADRMSIGAAIGDERIYESIYRCVFKEDGTPVFPDIETARELDLKMFSELFLAINEINGGGSKKSQPRTNGGTRSRSPSAEGRSRNGSKPSRLKKQTAGSNTVKSTDH